MEARLIEDRRRWNAFVAETPTGHLMQTFEWAENSGEATGAGSLRVGVLDGDRLVAAMLLVRSKAAGIARPYFYAPRGPVCADPDSPALAALIRSARQLARQAGGFFIRAEPNVAHDDAGWATALRQLGFHTTSHSLYLRNAWVTDLRASDDELLARMMTTWRQNIRAGARKGVTVRIGRDEADLDTFYRLLRETGERDRFYVYPRQLYRDMLANYSAEAAARDATAEMALFLAEYEGQPIAAATVAVLGQWGWNLHSGSSGQDAHRKLRPNYLLQWECMRWVKSRGAHFYDWRTIPEVLEPGQEMYGVYEFKRGFGGFVRRVLPTQDLVLRPAIYWPYMAAVSTRRTLRRWRRTAFERRRARTSRLSKAASSSASSSAFSLQVAPMPDEGAGS